MRDTSRRAGYAVSKDFMAWNGIWVHLAVIKRRRCKVLYAATPFSARIGVFHPEEIHVRGYRSFYKAAPLYYRRR